MVTPDVQNLNYYQSICPVPAPNKTPFPRLHWKWQLSFNNFFNFWGSRRNDPFCVGGGGSRGGVWIFFRFLATYLGDFKSL